MWWLAEMPKSIVPLGRKMEVPKNIRTLSAALMLSGVLGSSQTPSVKQDAKDVSCSNIVALAGNATVNCSSLTPQQRKILEGIPAVLNKILASQLDPEAVMMKLDEIQKGVNEIRNVTAERVISDADAHAIAAALREFKGQKVSMMFVSSDNETGRLAKQLQDILHSAEWDMPEQANGAMIFGNGLLIGIEITVRSAIPSANALASSLTRVLPNVHGHLVPEMKDDTIHITVMSKR
jgi:hypothetical protein